MKKAILITLATVFVSMVLFPGLTFGRDYRYDDYEYYDDYDNSYADYEFRFSDSGDCFDRCQGPVYYFGHPRGSVYFVLVGQRAFVVPAYIFSRYIGRPHFVWVPRTRFISLSGWGIDYYDSYLRFNYYFDFYNRYKWDRRHNRRLRHSFRKYYNGRHHQNWYHKNRQQVMKQRHLNNYRYNRSPKFQERQRDRRYDRRSVERYDRRYKQSYKTPKRQRDRGYDRQYKQHDRNYDRKRSYKNLKTYAKRHRK